MSCDNWVKTTIAEISLKIFSGGTPSTKNPTFWNGLLPWLSSGETKNNFIIETQKKITQEGVDASSTRLAKCGDIVIASAGQGFTRGQASVCKIDTYINQSIVAIRCNPKIADSMFVYYNIKNRYKELRGISDGHSIRGSLTTKLIKELDILLPSIQDQKAIANILSSLDDKIEINNRINKNLEEMAQALYKQWFVDFEFPNENGDPYKSSGGEMIESELGLIPKGWKVLRLTDELEFERGIEPGSRNYLEYQTNSTLPFFRVGDLLSIKDVYVESKFTKGKTCKKTDVLVAFDGAIGRTGLGLTGAYSSGLRKIYSKENTISNQLIYWIMKSEIIQNKIKEHANGTTILHAGSAINYLKIPFNKEQANKLSTILNPMFLKLIESKTENEKLFKTRDTLLPKLMSGEIEAPIKG